MPLIVCEYCIELRIYVRDIYEKQTVSCVLVRRPNSLVFGEHYNQMEEATGELRKVYQAKYSTLDYREMIKYEDQEDGSRRVLLILSFTIDASDLIEFYSEVSRLE